MRQHTIKRRDKKQIVERHTDDIGETFAAVLKAGAKISDRTDMAVTVPVLPCRPLKQKVDERNVVSNAEGDLPKQRKHSSAPKKQSCEIEIQQLWES